MNSRPNVSIVLPTYNRAVELSRAVESALNQSAPPDAYELIVVNNNSTDDTAGVVNGLSREHPGRIRGLVESRQGVSYARNAGIDAARGEIIAFFDDDVFLAPDWIETIRRVFTEQRNLQCVGGRVLPDWECPPPRWLTRTHWAPLALQDFGDEPMAISLQNPRALISANLACRKGLFARIGGFSPQFQRVKDGIGSLEDDEWIRRLWKAGEPALYLPELVTYAVVPATRLTRTYHRRWHSGHGRFYALLHADEMEQTSVGSLFGVPAHMYRSAIVDMLSWMAAAGRGHREQAFTHEVKLRFFRGFFSQRLTERLYS
jgi:glycosyltransferase involved in cell wall biosynthesis